MRYKLLGFFLVLLIATPVHGQEPSLVIVEALEPTPTTVKTGELFVELYKIEYLDLSNEGVEITINEKNLGLKALGDFEVVDFCIDKGERSGPCVGLGGGSVRKNFLEHIWYLKYTLRIVNPEKKTYKIPSLTVSWTEKSIGQNTGQAKSGNIQSGEVYVSYVTTVTEDPRLDVRDGFDFGSFSRTALAYRMAFWFCVTAVPVLWLVMLVVYLRSPVVELKLSSVGVLTNENLTDGFVAYKPVSKREASRALKDSINKLLTLANDRKNFDGSKIRPELVNSIMDFLRAWVSKSHVGMTPNDMHKLINETMIYAPNGPALLVFSKKAMRYQFDLESGVCGKRYWQIDPLEDAMILKKNLNRFRWHSRFLDYFKDVCMRIQMLSFKIRR